MRSGDGNTVGPMGRTAAVLSSLPTPEPRRPTLPSPLGPARRGHGANRPPATEGPRGSSHRDAVSPPVAHHLVFLLSILLPAAAALAEEGLAGLLPAKPGPRKAHKLTDEVLDHLEALRLADPDLSSADLASVAGGALPSLGASPLNRALLRPSGDSEESQKWMTPPRPAVVTASRPRLVTRRIPSRCSPDLTCTRSRASKNSEDPRPSSATCDGVALRCCAPRPILGHQPSHRVGALSGVNVTPPRPACSETDIDIACIIAACYRRIMTALSRRTFLRTAASMAAGVVLPDARGTAFLTSSQVRAKDIRQPTLNPFRGGFVLTDHANNPTTPRFDHGGFSRVACTVTSAGTFLRLVYGNFYYDYGDQPGRDAIRVRASIEYPAGHYILAHFTGEDSTRQATVLPGRYLVSEPLPVSVHQGKIVWVNTNVVPTPGSAYYVGAGVSPKRGEVSVRNTARDFTSTPAPPALMTGIDFVFSPLVVVGHPTGPPPKTVAVLGDSIAAGAGDINYAINGYAIGGWPLRGLDQKVGYVYLARTGEAFANIVGRGARYRFEMLEHQYSALVEYGRNDMDEGLRRVQQNAIEIWDEVAARGLRVFQTTITCQTNSTDGWISLENQSLLSWPSEATRLAFNVWLRSGAPMFASHNPVAPGSAAPGTRLIGEYGHPVSGLIDNCDLVESTRGSGLWRVPVPLNMAHPPILEGEVITVETASPHGVPVGAGGGANNGATVVIARSGSPFDGAHQVVTVLSRTRLQCLCLRPAQRTNGRLGRLYVPWTADGTHPSFVGAGALAAGLPVERLLA